jgi:hypothetical protein
LLDHHRLDEKRNAFKSAFGYVFQEYVGTLLREAFGPERVLSEWKYGPPSHQVDTPDWILLDSDRAVIIEVKQSSVFMDSKQWGRLDQVRDDIRKTIAKGARQLAVFELDVMRGTAGLEKIAHIDTFERVLVIYDKISFANSIIRNEIMAVNQDLGPNSVHVHVIPIEDFEYLLGHCWESSLFNLLWSKRVGIDEQDAMDFTDWMGHYLAPIGKHANPFLSAVFNSILDDWGIPSIASPEDV